MSRNNGKVDKDQERAELHRTIWKIADDLRGSVDGWDFKQYILGTLFYRFISENLTDYINAEERRTGTAEFDYAKLSDKQAELGRDDTVKEKGFYILPSELFANVKRNARNDADLNETLARVFRNIENSAKGTESEDSLKGLFDDLDVNSSKLGNTVERRNQKLAKLLSSIGELRFGDYADNSIDLFGDAYEYLMTMYASKAGKSGGEFFTPQEVSELLAEIATVGKDEVNKVYDPACGSGSLLLKFSKVLNKEKVRQGFFDRRSTLPTTIFAGSTCSFITSTMRSSISPTATPSPNRNTGTMSRLTRLSPTHRTQLNGRGTRTQFSLTIHAFRQREYLRPKGSADLAFTMHILSWLSTVGTAAIVEFPGVLYRSGAEQKFVNTSLITTMLMPSSSCHLISFWYQHRHLYHCAEKEQKREPDTIH